MILYADDSVLLCADKNLEYLKKMWKWILQNWTLDKTK